MIEFLVTLSHLSWKNWYDVDIGRDFIQLMHDVTINKKYLEDYLKKYSQNDLKNIYNEKHS